MAKTSDRFSSIEPRFGQHWGNLPVFRDDQISVLAYSYRELDYSEECVPLATEPQTEATQPKHQDIRPSKETNVSQSSEGSQAHLVASNKSPLYNPDSAQFLWEPTRELASFIDKQFRRKMSYDRVYEILDNYSMTSVDFLITIRLNNFLEKWKQITEDPEILNVVSGHRIPFRSIPVQLHIPVTKWSDSTASLIQM